MPPVTLPPTPQPSESLSRPAFVSAMDALVNWLYIMTPEFNTALTALNFNSTNSVSSSTMSIDLSVKNFVVDASKSYVKGMVVIVASTVNPSNFMAGNVMSYNTATGDIQVQPFMFRGSGTGLTSWTISLSAPDPEGDMVFIGSVSAANSAQIDIEDAFDDYDDYIIIGTGISYNTLASVYLGVRLKIGGAYITTTTYQYANDGAVAGAASDHIQIDNHSPGSAGDHVNFVMHIFKPSSSLPKTVNCNTSAYSGTSCGHAVRANNSNTAALTGVRFYSSLGNIETGKFSLYGVKNV